MQHIEPVQEIFGFATNDAAALSLTLFSMSFGAASCSTKADLSPASLPSSALLKIYPAGEPKAAAIAATAYDGASITSVDSDESASTVVGVYAAKARSTRSKDEGSVRAVRDGGEQKKKAGGLRRFFACGSGFNLD